MVTFDFAKINQLPLSSSNLMYGSINYETKKLYSLIIRLLY